LVERLIGVPPVDGKAIVCGTILAEGASGDRAIR
jgi:hypothetical protein